uniref:Uncharacterized protein n=1 Tax=Glossina brevipalpis TaxID=37001 RepID=A0A1A9W7V4_9MUSC
MVLANLVVLWHKYSPSIVLLLLALVFRVFNNNNSNKLDTTTALATSPDTSIADIIVNNKTEKNKNAENITVIKGLDCDATSSIICLFLTVNNFKQKGHNTTPKVQQHKTVAGWLVATMTQLVQNLILYGHLVTYQYSGSKSNELHHCHQQQASEH